MNSEYIKKIYYYKLTYLFKIAFKIFLQQVIHLYLDGIYIRVYLLLLKYKL